MLAIAYYRVSTKQQGASGLGLDAQRMTVTTSYKPIDEFIEVESGKNNTRPQLARALQECHLRQATLVIAKIDRLARNVHFISGLMESGVDFIACDNPNATRFNSHILAAVAEDEAHKISERTKAALQAAKRRGQLLGSCREGHWIGREDRRCLGATKGNAASTKVRQARAAAYREAIQPRVRELKDQGMSHREVAEALNELGYTTPRGSEFTKAAISKLLGGANARTH